MSKANKSKQKKKEPAVVVEQVVQYAPIEARSEWEISAETVLKAMGKHSYIDLSQNNKKVLANFYITTEGQESVDLHYLYELLLNREIKDVNEFVSMLLRIFENVVERFEALQDQEFMRRLVTGCKHLILYTKWLCLETFTLTVTGGSSTFLTISNRDNERREREKFLETAIIDATTISICRKLVKDMDKWKNKAESIQLSYFQVPVNDKLLADYSVYVRKPMDVGTIKAKLDATVPPSSSATQWSAVTGNVGRYKTHGEFIGDFRRVFTNAIKYNSAHLESDTTGLSKDIHEAALVLQARLEGLLPTYTLAAVDRYIVMQTEREEAQKIASKKQAYEAKLEEEVKQFEQETQAKLKATDQMYAHDLDAAAKRKETRQQIIKQQAAAHQVFRSGVIQDSMEVDDQRLVLEGGALLDPDAMVTEETIEDLPPNVSKRCGRLVASKKRLASAAWELFAGRVAGEAGKLQGSTANESEATGNKTSSSGAVQSASTSSPPLSKNPNTIITLEPPVILNSSSGSVNSTSKRATTQHKEHSALGTFSEASSSDVTDSQTAHSLSSVASISISLQKSSVKRSTLTRLSLRHVQGFDIPSGENTPTNMVR